MDKRFASTSESILRHAKRFEIATWFFLATMSLGLGYALYIGSSFFLALRQAQFQFAQLEQEDKVAGFVPFVNDVIATWPQRLAAIPTSWIELVAIVLAFVLGMGTFRIVRKSPRGKLLIEISPDSVLLRDRVQRALELSRSKSSLFVRTDNGEEAGYSKKMRAVFLPVSFAQKLYRKLLDNAPEQLAFLVVHEELHGASSDNLLWSWGRSLTFLLTAISAALIASPIMMAAAAAFPAKLVQSLPFPLCFGLVTLFIVVLLAFIGTVTNGVLPNIAATREFFADALAAHTPEIGPQSLPYEGTTDSSRRGNIMAGWSMIIPGPDRRLHARGITPRTGALAASTVAMWVLVRSLILMLDPDSWLGVVWVFDAAYLMEIAAILYSLPRRHVGLRDYGILPWVTTIILTILIPLSFVVIDKFCSAYGIASIIRPLWLAAVAIPPFAIIAAILLWRRATAVLHHDHEEIDRLPPRLIGIGQVAQLIAAMPSYIWSYTTAGLALFTWCTTLAAWSSLSSYSMQSFLFDALSLPICAVLAIIVAKNFRALHPWSAAVEAISGVIAFTLFAYATMSMIIAAAQSPPGNSGPPFNFGLFVLIFLSHPTELVTKALGAGSLVGAVLLASWEMRFRFHTHTSLFKILKVWLASSLQDAGTQIRNHWRLMKLLRAFAKSVVSTKKTGPRMGSE
jgi:hypothetical protein